MKTTITNSYISIQIKHLGAELCSLKNNDKQEYIWEGNPNFWGKHSPILFPIVGALKNNTYLYNDQSYSLTRHGFARDMVFELIEKKEDSATFSLSYNSETLAKYPFEFELQIKYILVAKKVSIEYHVLNHGQSSMPFSIGGHPAFSLPNNFEDYQLEFETNDVLNCSILEQNLISNQTKSIKLENKNLNLNYELFANDALIFKQIKSKHLVLKHQQKPVLKINFSDFPDFGIWTNANAPFICLEPWFGFSEGINGSKTIFDKEGILILNAQEKFQSSYSVEIY